MKNDNIRAIPIYREQPDVKLLARTLVQLAYQLEAEKLRKIQAKARKHRPSKRS